MLRSLERRGDAGELTDQPGTHLFVQPLGVPRFRHFQRRIDVDLKKSFRAHDAACLLAGRSQRRDEGHDGRDARLEEDGRHLSHPALIFRAVGLGKAEIAAKPLPDDVAVQNEGVLAPRTQQRQQFPGDGGFPGAGEPGEPVAESLCHLYAPCGIIHFF